MHRNKLTYEYEGVDTAQRLQMHHRDKYQANTLSLTSHINTRLWHFRRKELETIFWGKGLTNPRYRPFSTLLKWQQRCWLCHFHTLDTVNSPFTHLDTYIQVYIIQQLEYTDVSYTHWKKNAVTQECHTCVNMWWHRKYTYRPWAFRQLKETDSATLYIFISPSNGSVEKKIRTKTL